MVYGGAGRANSTYGGDGDDLLSYVSSNTAVIVSLASGTGLAGEAEGDVFAAFEDVLGSPYDDSPIWATAAPMRSMASSATTSSGARGRRQTVGELRRRQPHGRWQRSRSSRWRFRQRHGGLRLFAGGRLRRGLMTGDASGGDAAGDVFFSIENLSGSGHADTLWGNNGGNVLEGNAGNDLFKGFGGADTIDGGQGIDTASYDDSSTGVQVNLLLGKGHGGSAEGDKLKGIENLTGAILYTGLSFLLERRDGMPLI